MEEKIIREKFLKFKEKYSSRYKKQTWQYIEENFFAGLTSPEIPDILMQIYAELELTPTSGNFYHQHFNLIKENFPLTGNIIEIASGRLPILANMIAKEQLTIGKGRITIYEPLLIDLTPKYPNLEIHKQFFNSNVDISNSDLIIGIMPCEVTETILKSAITNDKDFYVALCGCIHSPSIDIYNCDLDISLEQYQQEVITKTINLLKENGNSSLEITRLHNHPIDYPILYNKRLSKTLH